MLNFPQLSRNRKPQNEAWFPYKGAPKRAPRKSHNMSSTRSCLRLMSRFRNDTKEFKTWQRMNRLPRDNEMCSMRPGEILVVLIMSAAADCWDSNWVNFGVSFVKPLSSSNGRTFTQTTQTQAPFSRFPKPCSNVQ